MWFPWDPPKPPDKTEAEQCTAMCTASQRAVTRFEVLDGQANGLRVRRSGHHTVRNVTVIHFAEGRIRSAGHDDLPALLGLFTPRALFVNLTSGAEWLPLTAAPVDSLGFTRIQSTACEQKRWDFIIRDLDQNLLLKLALGFQCEIYDCGARKDTPRAIWQGLAFIHYVLTRRWQRLRPTRAFVRNGLNVADYFEAEYRKLSHWALSKVDYYRDFYDFHTPRPIRLVGVSCPSRNDGDKSLHVGLVRRRVTQLRLGEQR